MLIGEPHWREHRVASVPVWVSNDFEDDQAMIDHLADVVVVRVDQEEET